MSTPKVNLRKIKRKSGIVYQLDYSFQNRRIREIVGSNKRDAELIQAKLQTDLALGKFDLVPGNNAKSISLENLIEEWLNSRKNEIRPPSLNRYRSWLKTFREFMYKYFSSICYDVRLIKENYIKESINQALNKWHPKTVNGMRDTISSVFKYGIHQGYLEINPVSNIKQIPVPETDHARYFTDAELIELLTAVDSFWKDHYKFITLTGLRKSEFTNLIWENVNLEGKNPSITIISSRDWKTKTGKKRIVNLNKSALKIITKWKGKHNIYVFTDKRGNMIDSDRFLYVFKKALAKTDLYGDIHMLRHTFARKILESGATFYELGKLLGHSESSVTEKYAHFSPDHMRKVVEKIN
jgi:integrase